MVKTIIIGHPRTSQIRSSSPSTRIPESEFVEVFVDTPLEVPKEQYPKGIYKMARHEESPNFTGIDGPYEAPEAPEFWLATGAGP